jgi:subtilisin family serine protease
MFTTKQLSLLMTTTQEHSEKKYLFWHQKIPTIGLRKDEVPISSFIPHFFSLWQLAPKKGKGVKIAIIDTGITLRKISPESYELHPQLNHHSFFVPHFLNLMNYDMQEIVTNLTNRVSKHSHASLPECEKIIIISLHEYCCRKTIDSLIIFLTEHECYNVQFINDFIKILDSYDKKRFFTSIKIPTHDNHTLLELLPITKNTFGMAAHGTALCGVIGAREHPIFGPLGLAPNAEIIMIKAFDDYGCSNKGTLLQALKKVHTLGIPLVNVSLKISDCWQHDDQISHAIEEVIAKIPYVVAAAGNCADAHAVRHEAYPARLPSVAFDVGAFSFDGNNNTYLIASFSQYEHSIGPKIVAPGFNIMSTTFADDPAIEYGFFHGTSIATALITGFVALILSEFGENFTREQLLKVCYKATVRLQATQEWHTKTLLGTIDMRCALFMLHALYRFKELGSIRMDISYDFRKYFDWLLELLHSIVYRSCNKSSVYPYFLDLSHAVEYVVDKMFLQLQTDKVNSSVVNLFSSVSFATQRRIQSVL